MSGTEPDLALCLQEAEQVARQAGKYVLEGFHATKNVDTKRGPWDLVTEYDRGTENIVVSELKKRFPNHKFIGEEAEAGKIKSTELSDDPTWIIDPIDGTTNFVHGFHETCISIGLTVNKEPVVGVVYNPVMDHIYTARKGNGAYFNGQRIYSSKCTDLDKSLVAMEISFARIPEYRAITLARLKSLVKVAQAVRSIGTAALSLCYVAAGSLDAYNIDGLYSWDVTAGAIILREAGGVIVNSDGTPLDLMGRKYLGASSQALADKLADMFTKADSTVTK